MEAPFVDLFAQYQSIKSEMDKAIADVIFESAYIGGKRISLFEQQFAQFVGVKNCVACANGTDSLEILLQAYGVGAGDEVIIPAHSWFSSAEAVHAVGATPVFIDSFPGQFTMNTSLIEAKINANTKVIMPVHLYGNPAEMDTIMNLANKYKLKVIEDCAQAHGAVYKGMQVGTIGHAASYSFYPGKNLGAYGDAGAMVTNDDELAEKIRMISLHGQKGKHNHLIAGRNSRLDGLQAAVLSVKLPYLAKWNESRRKHASTYDKLITNPAVTKPKAAEHCIPVYHLYVIKINNRDELAAKLKEAGVETAVHYPTAMPFLKVYDGKYAAEGFPVAKYDSSTILSLPMYAELSDEQINYVAKLVNDYAN